MGKLAEIGHWGRLVIGIAAAILVCVAMAIIVVAWAGEIIGAYRFFRLKRHKPAIIVRLKEKHPDFDSTTCPTVEDISRYVWGRLSSRREAEIWDHLFGEHQCYACRQIASKLSLPSIKLEKEAGTWVRS